MTSGSADRPCRPTHFRATRDLLTRGSLASPTGTVARSEGVGNLRGTVTPGGWERTLLPRLHESKFT